MAQFMYALTSSNVDQSSNLFDCQNQEKICNNTNTINKDPTTPQVRRCINSCIQMFSKLNNSCITDD